eukprot:4860968-Prorocentrum_lima.AAC.1
MTSSLVGSEMCIRDRPHTMNKCRNEDTWASALDDDILLARLQRTRLLTVSYTHLTLPTICSV